MLPAANAVGCSRLAQADGPMNRSAALPFAADKRAAAGRLHVRPPPSGFMVGDAFAIPGQVFSLWCGTGIEPATARFLVWCSTVELTWLTRHRSEPMHGTHAANRRQDGASCAVGPAVSEAPVGVEPT